MKTMKVKVTDPKVRLDYKHLEQGKEHDVPDWFGRDLIASDKAVLVRDPSEGPEEAPDFARAVVKPRTPSQPSEKEAASTTPSKDTPKAPAPVKAEATKPQPKDREADNG